MSDFAKDTNTLDASWKLYDAERMANESLRQQLAEKDAEIARRITLDEMTAEVESATKAVADFYETQLSEKDAVINRLQFALADTEALELGTAERLAGSQLREQQLREALNHHHEIGLGRGRDKSHSLSQLIISAYKHGLLCRITEQALAMPADTSALEAMIAKAGEVMRERCDSVIRVTTCMDQCKDDATAIRALPGVTLGDLTK